MKRAWVATIAALGITLLLLTWPAPEREGPADAVIAAQGVAPADVRVEHHLITAEIVQDRPAAVPDAARPAVAARIQRSARHEPEVTGLFARAKRALLGDGRHRPEPFPRAKQQ